MPKPAAKDFELLRLIHKAAFANPFGEERDQLDYKIAGISKRTTNQDLMNRVKDTVRSLIHKLGDGTSVRVDQFEGEAKAFVQTAILFDVFHRFEQQFDEYIQKQSGSGTKDPIVFAQDALRHLVEAGFDASYCEKVFAIFYQMRRAYFFIGKGIVGSSPCMVKLRKRLWENVFTSDSEWYEAHLWNRMEDFSTLLLGDTGTGKGTVAAAIGKSGYIPFDNKSMGFAESFTDAFVSINLSSYPESIIESELFGHRKGAFTGAIDNHTGVFERCSEYGSIFIDEVGDVNIPTQVKLLNVLQERSFSPVGSRDHRRFAGRVIAATNKNLDDLRATGEFRNDFYYRLCSDVIFLPSLRHRLDEDETELTQLVGVILDRIASHSDQSLADKISARIQDMAMNYSWPGNVRELEQAVRRVLLTGHYDAQPIATKNASLFADAVQSKMSAADLLTSYCDHLYEIHGTYEDVARVTGLDRRTVKKYILKGDSVES